MLIPSAAACPSVDTGKPSPCLQSLPRVSDSPRLYFREAVPQMSSVSRTTGQAMPSCVPGEGLPPQNWVLSLMASVKVTAMDWGSCLSPARRVHR